MFSRYTDFTGLYSLQKTLRFELKPVGRTLEYIKNTGLIDDDELRNKQYYIVKSIIDRFHARHIDEALSLIDFNDHMSELEQFEKLYFIKNKNEEEKRKFDEISKNLRKIIVSYLTGNAKLKTKMNALNKIKERYQILFGKELFQNDEFLSLAQTNEEKDAITSFKGFTTYFTGFHENRKNMYSEEEESTAIAYRIIHENLPRFLYNKTKFDQIKDTIDKSTLNILQNNLKQEIGSFKLNEIFTLNYFGNILTQTGITNYNTFIGGKTKENGKKIQGLNEIINLYNQQNEEGNLPLLKLLYKQILSERQSASFVISAFENDEDVLNAINTCWGIYIIEALHTVTGKKYNLLNNIKKLCDKIAGYKDEKLKKLYIEKKKLSTVSHQVYGQWNVLRDALKTYYESHNENASEKEINKFLEKDAFSWKELQDAIAVYKIQVSEEDIDETALVKYFSEMKIRKDDTDGEDVSGTIIEDIQKKYEIAKPILNEKRAGRKDLHQEKDKVAKIKDLLDALKKLQWFLKLLYVESPVEDKNYEFYNELELYYETLMPLNNIYNKVRNYMTRKPYSVEKFKLNFSSPTFLFGWDKNKETSNLGVILKKDDKYFLGIMNKENNYIFDNMPVTKTGNTYEKMVYKLLPGPNKMLPKVFFSKKGKETYKPPKSICDLYERNEFKKGNTFKKESMWKLIDFYKNAIARNKDWDSFNFKFKDTQQYDDISQFYREVEEQGYAIKFEKVDDNYINTLVDEGKLYLFQIYNKDFSDKKKSNGNPNLHTIYWKNIFTDDNSKHVVYKLNGEAEVFFRKASLQYSDEIWKEGHHAEKLKGKYGYPIIKDRRYAEDKFLFHVPITMNFISKRMENVNQLMSEYIQNTKENYHVIGIDRGERNLLYISLIDSNGKIVKNLSLNKIQNENYEKEIDYRMKLDEKEKNRAEARKNWDVIENIKELKEGYLSQVVHAIAKLMVEYKAIVVMEDLNAGFKRGRFKVEKQVYQKFEKMLIDKLNYLVFKNKKPSEPGGSLNAYQLASPFKSFKKLGKQSGMILYVPSAYTSKIDPTTGFYNFLRVDVSTERKAKDFFEKIDKILYNAKEDYFEFHCKYENFVSLPEISKKTKEEKLKTECYNAIKSKTWIICSTHHERFKVKRNKSGHIEYKNINVNEELKQIFTQAGINFEKNNDLKLQILNSMDAKYLKLIGEQIKVLLAMRYNNGKHGSEEKDYIVSPVKNQRGSFFCTLDGDPSLPADADANGAYNIALKGLLVIDKIRRTTDERYGLTVSNLEWFNYMMNR